MRTLALAMTAMLLLAAAGRAPDLAAYVGKEPFESVRGVTFFRHPAVTRAVGAVVGSVPLTREILNPTGPSSPVEATATGFKADGCQAHNCGDHHWTFEVAQGGAAATVCYHDAATMGQKSRWYMPGRPSAMRPGTCFAPG